MSYSRLKVWIAAEVLTASDLNNEHNGHITNENDLDTRLISEITTRSTLETEYDAFYAACWNAGSSEVAANRVSKTSMKDDSVGLVEIEAAATDPAAGTGGLRTLGTTSVKACAGNDARLSDARAPTGSQVVTQGMLKTSQASVSITEKQASSTTTEEKTLPGGEYGFWTRLQLTRSVTGGTLDGYIEVSSYGTESAITSMTNRIKMTLHAGLDAQRTYNGYVQQRYVTASGEIHWIFILRDKETKKIGSMWQAPDHPCFGNGGKPLLVPHPFGDYDKTKYEIIVVNPSPAEIEQMELETIVDDETKPDKDLLEVITENYIIDEASEPKWPTIPVTVGLPKHIKDKKGKKVLADYRFMDSDTVVAPVRKVVLKPAYIKCRSLRKI